MRESEDVVRNDDVEPTLRCVDLANFEYLHVITEYVRGHLKWSDIDNFDIPVSQIENAA